MSLPNPYCLLVGHDYHRYGSWLVCDHCGDRVSVAAPTPPTTGDDR